MAKSPPAEIPWISTVADFAQSGIPQAIVLVSSLVSVAIRLFQLRHKIFLRRPKASTIRWKYELPSQAARLVSVSFVFVAYYEGRVHLLNPVLLAYALVLGLLRLFNDLDWRHVALHQVNFVYTMMLVILCTAHCLPCIQVASQCLLDSCLIGSLLSLVLASACAIATPREWVPAKIDFNIPGRNPDDKPAPEESSSWLAYYFTYGWLTPIIWKGTKGKLNLADVPRIAWYDEPMYLLHKVQDARSISKNTLRTAIRFQKRELVHMSLWIGTSYAVENVAAYGMFKLLEYLANPSGATYTPWLWLMLMFFGPLCRSVSFQQYIFTSTRLVVRIKSAFTQELYSKALGSMELEDDPFELHLDSKTQKKQSYQNTAKSTSAGRLSNLMASDVDAIYKARDMVVAVIGVPVSTIISLIGMYRMLGWASLVGTFILVLATPMSIWLGKKMLVSQRRVRKAQDSRMSLVTEYLASLRAIKYFAWETPITEHIIEARAAEQKELWHVSFLQAMISQITQLFPYLSLLVMFALHVGLQKHRLEASTAFTTIFLSKNIRRNTMQASSFARNFAAALVSVGRLDKYFESTVPITKYPVGPLRVQRASFRRNKKAVFSLSDISLEFAEGGLNVVSGPSGSGKSTLLMAILGETYIESGSVTRPGDVAYASQSSWLQNESIQANIVFSASLEKARYDRVIEACCLSEDFRELPEGDMTVVGENGTSLSGGQKARVALARALYSKAPLLLLDDVFAALDAKTSAGVWKYCFCTDMLAGRTTVLVTNMPWISEQADFSVQLENGRLKLAEAHIGVVRKPIALAQVLGGDAEDMGTSDGTQTESQPHGYQLNDVTPVAIEKKPTDIVSQEMKASGKVGRLTFLEYMSYFGNPFFVASVLGVLVLTHVLGFTGSLWLSVWVDAYDQQAHVDIAYYMGIFALITLLDIGFYSIVIIMFEWGAWNAARRLHNEFIRAMMRVSLSWFKHIPIGRITNRFSSDIASIDGTLSIMLRTMLDALLMMLFRLVAVSSIMPIFMVPAAFTCFFGMIIGEMYTRTAVILKRLASSSQSPVFSQFADTLAGLSVIRARAGMPETFKEELAAKLRLWTAAAETQFTANRWVAVRVDFITALVALSAGIIAVSKAGIVAAGLVGFSLSSANGLSQTILMLVRAMNDLEVEMQSVHRIKEYVKLEPEEVGDETYPDEGEYTDDPSHIIPKNWPRRGVIEFRNVTIRYDPDGPDVLSDVNLKFRAGERVAVVGRTGSGKSTLLLSLLRFTEVVSGQIFYDGVDITKVPRRRLREGLTIIPQEAVLFNGTVKSNLDPSGSAPEEVLQKALDNCKGIASFAARRPDGTGDADAGNGDESHNNAISLDTSVEPRGENFSHGQRQVLSLCRALIRQSKLMLLDEATASMDYETDRGIQTVLRQELQESGGDRTLVTIAHRLRTIIDYDTVVVMSAGRVIECGPPRDLFHARGQFYDMVYHSGEMEELEAMLQES
ncbi:P-loop containing nucleoside triphosphate hydrolase protein [Mariannaea sp. PMI_226]|nr:P-loop containing nucleoside triphosphate hydrolase protein [Mariannaea sp. PMI_226]